MTHKYSVTKVYMVLVKWDEVWPTRTAYNLFFFIIFAYMCVYAFIDHGYGL